MSYVGRDTFSIPDQIGADVFGILNSAGKPITVYAPLSPRPSPDGLRAVCDPVPNYAHTYAQINSVADRDRPLYSAVNLPEQVAVTSKCCALVLGLHYIREWN